MVVDKDMEGLGEWTLGEVKTEWIHTCTCCTALQMEGSKLRVCLQDVANFLCTGRIRLV